MDLKYLVHRVSSHLFATIANVGGEEMPAHVQAVEVEMTPVDHNGGTILHRFIGAAAEEAKKLYQEGQQIVLSFNSPSPPSGGQQ